MEDKSDQKDPGKDTMDRKYWNSHLQKMTGYTFGLQPEITADIVKLNSNESPYPPSPEVLEAIRKAAGPALRLYPRAEWDGLRRALSREYSVPEEAIFCSNGSDEFLSLIFRTFAEPGNTACLTNPTYSLYRVLARAQGIQIMDVDCDADFRINFDELLKRQAKITIITNPNTPTGALEAVKKIEEFVKIRKGLVLVDEAYIDFSENPTANSALRLIEKYDNLLVARTFSKSFSLCGIRAGYAFGCPDLISALLTAKDSYNLDTLAQAAAEAAILDINWMRDNAARVVRTREASRKNFLDLGFGALPSQANFLFVSHPKHDAGKLYNRLLEKNIYIRYFPYSPLDRYLRVSIGSDKDMERFFSALQEILSSEATG